MGSSSKEVILGAGRGYSFEPEKSQCVVPLAALPLGVLRPWFQNPPWTPNSSDAEVLQLPLSSISSVPHQQIQSITEPVVLYFVLKKKNLQIREPLQFTPILSKGQLCFPPGGKRQEARPAAEHGTEDEVLEV